MQELFVNYDVAMEFRKIGFDEPCFAVYEVNDSEEVIEVIFNNLINDFSTFTLEEIDNMRHLIETGRTGVLKNFNHNEILPTFLYAAPTYQQAVEWLDKNHKIRIDLTHASANGTYNFTIWKWNFDNNVGNWERISSLGTFTDYKERNHAAIKEALKLVSKQEEVPA